jgi:outer membrane protein
MARSFASAGLLLALFAFAGPAWAQPAPLTFRAAVSEALSASPSLRAPADGQTLATIQESQAEARFGLKATPSFQQRTDPAGFAQRTIGVDLSRRLETGTDVTFSMNSLRFGTGQSALDDTGYQFAVSQPLLAGFGQAARQELSVARRGRQTAGRTYREARQQLVVSVADAYFGVLRSGRIVASAERSLGRAVRLRTSSDARARVGLATELDVLRADLLASQAEAALVGQQEAYETALDRLKQLLGRSPDADVRLDESALDDADALNAFAPDVTVGDDGDVLGHLVQTALVERLDVQEAHDRIGDARLTESVARWNLLPPVRLDVSYTRRGIAGGAEIFGDLFNGWRVGLATSYSLDRADQSAAAATASLAARSAERESIDTERRVADDVRRAYRAWMRTASTLAIQSKAVNLAEQQLRLAEIRYERGVAGNFDVVDAETNLFQMQSSQIGAEVERALAGLVLRRAVGMLDPEVFLP